MQMTALICYEMQNHWKKLLKLISEFSEVAGPKPNLKKTWMFINGLF